MEKDEKEPANQEIQFDQIKLWKKNKNKLKQSSMISTSDLFQNFQDQMNKIGPIPMF